MTDATRADPALDIRGAGAGDASEARREAILAAALDVFVEHGFKGATIKALAAAAGLRSPALLYWNFPNKEDVFRGVLRRHIPVLDDDDFSDRSFEQPPDVFLASLMRKALARFADPATGKAYWLLVREHALLARSGFSMSAARPNNIATLVIDYLRAQIERGALRQHSPEAVARLLVAQLNLALQLRIVPMGLLPAPPDDETLIAETLDIVLQGIRP